MGAVAAGGREREGGRVQREREKVDLLLILLFKMLSEIRDVYLFPHFCGLLASSTSAPKSFPSPFCLLTAS